MDILCVASVDWDESPRQQQEIVSALAAQGHRVLYVETTGVQSRRFGELGRLRRRFKNARRGTKGFREEKDRLFVYSPMLFPFPFWGVAVWFNTWRLGRALRRWMRAAAFTHPVVWTFLPTPLAARLVREVNPALTVYHATGDLPIGSSRAAEAEIEVVREADLVFVPSEAQRPRIPQLSAGVHVIPFDASEANVAEMTRLVGAAFASRVNVGSAWQASLRQTSDSARRQALRFALALAVLYVVIFQLPTLWFVAAPLRVEESPQPADAIVVFAGGVGESGDIGGGYQERIERAIDLYRLGLSQKIVISSGFVFRFKETDIMAAIAQREGIPASAIVLESQGTNTYENVRNVKPILEKEGAKKVLLVSAPYHMRRALLVWKKAAPDIEVVPASSESYFYEHSWGANFRQIRGIALEYAAILVYWLRGWL